jgi:putative ABC transport system permease protein
MSLSIRPIAAALLRNRAAATLVVLQIAIAFAVITNAAWVVEQRIAKIEQPTGLDTPDTFAIGFAGLTKSFDVRASIHTDLAYLRSLPGVIDATATLGIPLTGNGQGTRLWREPGERGRTASAMSLQVDQHGLKTLGTRLLAGRDFRPEEIQVERSRNFAPSAPEVILTRSLARALFPAGDALGKAVYEDGGAPMTVIGITRDFIGLTGMTHPENVALVPEVPAQFGAYWCIVRTRPGRRDAVMRTAVRHMGASNLDRVILFAHTFAYYKRRLDAENRNVAIFLTTVTALIVVITCLGIFGLMTYNVSARTKQIGTLRAVGARKRDVIAYFMTENALILAAGTLLGCMLALAVGYWLSSAYALPRLDLSYIAIGALLLAAIGQGAAWQPARRAAAVPPSVATRTV